MRNIIRLAWQCKHTKWCQPTKIREFNIISAYNQLKTQIPYINTKVMVFGHESLPKYPASYINLNPWTSKEYTFDMCVSDADMRGNPIGTGLGQRPHPVLYFVLSRPKGLDEQWKYCPRMGIRICLKSSWILRSLRSPRTQLLLRQIRIPIFGTIYFLGSPSCPHLRGTYLI